jgi:collagenase-like PrtC family protease
MTQELSYSIPYNSDPATLAEVCKLKHLGSNSIVEVYLSGPQANAGSGRIVPEMDQAGFALVVNRIHQAGLRANLVLNSTCEGSAWYARKTVEATLGYIGQAHEELGVEAVTLANPLYISRVKERFPELEVCASVLGNIDCVQRAVIYRQAGADVITPDANINRNLGLLAEIKEATGARLKLLANEGCLYKCPFRQFHFNAKSHVSREVSLPGLDVSCADFFGAGTGVIGRDLSQLLRSPWIRPEDVRRYADITTSFKLVCRSQGKGFVTRAARAYLQERWEGDLLDLVSGCAKRFSMNEGAYLGNPLLGMRGFFDRVTTCDNRCHRCGYCRELAGELVQMGVFTPEKGEDALPADAG